ncbi:ABC transporter ATP-binding protein [Mycoplasma sp. P36-A1]|uniref:ABC transporter ATP-binding protein n=1 Tax=Mycoplasma sp. P36-A1 TaxID=3252900 RepID=UPI003C2B29BC
MTNVIKIKNLKKIFRFFKKDYMVFYWLFTKKGFTKEFRVLNGLTFNVAKGERVGILGKNGAGKSTLLKIISGIYFPTSGEIEVNGKIASLIELGAGFNKELTGRENVYLKGSLLGLTKADVDNVIEDIIAFADIGDYIDMPLGTYSSGMSARLGFALAVNADADILIIDEVFAVGDKNFQKKSRAKTEELLRSGKTVLFVSHSESLIKEFCDRVIYLKEGHIEYDGEVDRGLALYHADNLKLKRQPTVSFVEFEIAEQRLRLRFDVGIGAEGNVIKKDKIEEFRLYSTRFDNKTYKSVDYDVFDFDIEYVSEYLLDVYINLQDVLNSDVFSFTFTHPSTGEKMVNTSFTTQNIDEEIGCYEFRARNYENNFSFDVRSVRFKDSEIAE